MADTISVPQHYLDTLIRRAALHAESESRTDDSILITKAEYNELKRVKREHLLLRDTLIRGGLTVETLDTLLAGATGPGEGYDHIEAWEVPAAPQAGLGAGICGGQGQQDAKPGVTVTETESEFPIAPFPRASGNHLATKPPFIRQASGAISSFVDVEDDFMGDSTEAYASKAPFPRNDQRTVFISNLSDKATHLDIARLMRGGRLLDIHLRSDRTAAVSFVEGATDFLAYTKRKDFYLHGKRLEFKWAERQFHMPYHVANKIAQGASRNIVVRTSMARSTAAQQQEPLTERGIRDDLEHIHNLQVVSATLKNGDWYISTNSVHNALFARTCMMSRGKYKGMKIEWYPDECAQPIPQVERNHTNPPRKSQNKPAVTKPAAAATSSSLANRFGVLDMDGMDESSSEPKISNAIGATRWADEGIAV